MWGRAFIAAIAIGFFPIVAQAKCYGDPGGYSQVCESINQARRAAALSPSDSTVLTTPTRAITIGDAAACSIRVLMVDDSSPVTLPNRQPGLDYSYSITRLYATGTTCTSVIALYVPS